MEINKNETEDCQKDEFKLNITSNALPFEIVNAYAMLKSRIDHELLDESIAEERREVLNAQKEKAREECIYYLKNNMPEVYNSFTGEDEEQFNYETYSCACLCDEKDHLNGTCDCCCRENNLSDDLELEKEKKLSKKQIIDILPKEEFKSDFSNENMAFSLTNNVKTPNNDVVLENRCDVKYTFDMKAADSTGSSHSVVHPVSEPSNKTENITVQKEEEHKEQTGCFGFFKWILCLHK